MWKASTPDERGAKVQEASLKKTMVARAREEAGQGHKLGWVGKNRMIRVAGESRTG